MRQVLVCRFFRRAFGWCVPIGALGGLVGLGGGEFRLPVLIHAIGLDARSAVPVNLIVSFITLAFAMIVRSHAISMTSVTPYLPEIVGLIAGGCISAFHGARLVQRLSSERLVQVIGVLLAALGMLLLAEAVFPFQDLQVMPTDPAIRFIAGAAIGLGIGLVSSMLGVAGGELLIPTLMFVFGADIRTAGSASIVISLCLIVVGLGRYWRLGAIPSGKGIQRITAAMGAGSILGALIGGIAVALAPVAILKVFLGGILVASAIKTVWSHR